MGTKESVYIRKEINSHRIGLEHQHGRRFLVLEHQYDRRDVMWNTVDNEVSALARLNFYEILLIGQETSVRCPHWRVSISSGLYLEKM